MVKIFCVGNHDGKKMAIDSRVSWSLSAIQRDKNTRQVCRFLFLYKGFSPFFFFLCILLILCFSTSEPKQNWRIGNRERRMGSLKDGQRRDLEGGEEESEEPLLTAQNQRFTMFPIRYKSIWEMNKKAEASFWTGLSSLCFCVCFTYFVLF